MTLVCVARCNDPVVLAGLWHGVPFALIATVTGRKSFMVAGDLPSRRPLRVLEAALHIYDASVD
jgi:hypothetical protein